MSRFQMAKPNDLCFIGRTGKYLETSYIFVSELTFNFSLEARLVKLNSIL